eukprot:TRINITY_DN4666_c0_g1_i1.p1 TRINITY_DN4666_c0_g1~~TRINITY_DN4666_c0_g1_i1.p1  ORF type:complete len:152 (+),score=29.92 TRINITY_DN4666_c0_g1_i1:197-652(+)
MAITRQQTQYMICLSSIDNECFNWTALLAELLQYSFACTAFLADESAAARKDHDQSLQKKLCADRYLNALLSILQSAVCIALAQVRRAPVAVVDVIGAIEGDRLGVEVNGLIKIASLLCSIALSFQLRTINRERQRQPVSEEKIGEVAVPG